MSILDRSALQASPLADLHALASELSIDGYRRLRRPDLIDAIITRQGGMAEEPAVEEPAVEEPAVEEPAVEEPAVEEPAVEEPAVEEPAVEEPAVEKRPRDEEPGEEERAGGRRRRGRRGGRGRSGEREERGPAPAEVEELEEQVARAVGEEPAPARDAHARREEPVPARDTRARGEEPAPARDTRARGEETVPARDAEDELVEGEVELLPNGSGFLRVHPPEPSEDDVYISAAQVKRCELVPGDRISGPRRAARRSERFASLIRVDTINGRPADEVADSTRFEDLPAAFPSERFRLGSEDPTVKGIEWLTPFGRGSRVTIVGPPRAGKSEALRRLAAALAPHEEIQLLLVLAGVRPEEISEWQQGPVEPLAAVSFAASPDAQAQTIDRAVDQARRLAARGAHVVVLIDTLSGLPPHAARKVLAAARNIAGGASLTVIATAVEPLGGETTVISLDALLASTGRFPAIDLLGSWTIRPDLLVGEDGAEAIARARSDAVDR